VRTDLVRERGGHWQRMEKLLEDALIKVTTVASRIDTMAVRDMIEALTGRFDDHGELARILLSQIDSLTAQVDAHRADRGADHRDASSAGTQSDGPGPGSGYGLQPGIASRWRYPHWPGW
jgi:transposase